MAKCTVTVKRGYSEKEGPYDKTLMLCNHLVYDSSIWGGGGGGRGIYRQPCTQGIKDKVYMCYACVCD